MAKIQSDNTNCCTGCREQDIFYITAGFPCGSAGKELACNAGDLSLILGLGRSPGGGKGYPLQCSCLENSMDYIVLLLLLLQSRFSRVRLFATPWTVHGILQARILEWVAFPSSRGSSQPRDRTQVSRIAADSLLAES